MGAACTETPTLGALMLLRAFPSLHNAVLDCRCIATFNAGAIFIYFFTALEFTAFVPPNMSPEQ